MDKDSPDLLDALDDLVRELLLERTEGLDAPQLAAFIDGWGSLLRLLEHTGLVVPGAPPELVDGLAAIVARVRESQARVFDDDD
ncbi:hypothetical protein ENSA5_14600 [Enhygromyxa salina]|uniref:Uncharacterized protein n=1 Tax=Enhygromyxa salina TaxID=215803 RepID=A0A2S9YEZ5_9BACT|nr:hypothetical protein [Enhygromyxa salina]PRQ03586.1 hypothetical protein ENSA5_14600 [Enhygromyxa salina]